MGTTFSKYSKIWKKRDKLSFCDLELESVKVSPSHKIDLDSMRVALETLRFATFGPQCQMIICFSQYTHDPDLGILR